MTKAVLYNDQLADEWSDWVETPNPEGSREKDLFPLFADWLKNTKPSTLIDIGCGQGIISTLLADDISYLGIDVSPPLISRATERYSDTGRKFREGNAYSLPVEPQSFDAAVSFWVWSHLEVPKKAANEMARVLKPGGAFLIITANPATYDMRRAFYLHYEEKDGLLTGDFDLGNGKKLSNSTLYLHSENELRSAVTESGLRIGEMRFAGASESREEALYLVMSGFKD